MMEVPHMELTAEELIIEDNDAISILNNIYVVHQEYFNDRRVPYRRGMHNVFTINNAEFLPYNYYDAQTFSFINSEHNYLMSRIGISQVYLEYEQY